LTHDPFTTQSSTTSSSLTASLRVLRRRIDQQNQAGPAPAYGGASEVETSASELQMKRDHYER